MLKLAQEMGWDVIISLKQNSRDLYPSVVRLFSRRPPDASFTETQDHKTYRVQLWDTEGLPFTVDNPEPVRVVRSKEVLERNRFREGKRTRHGTDHEWLWITTLPQAVFPAAVIRRLGHSRWKNENNGWMDLTRHWALKQGFLHACVHPPTPQCGGTTRTTRSQSRLSRSHFDLIDCSFAVLLLCSAAFEAGSAR